MTLLSWLISIITLILGFIVSFVLGQITAKMKLQHQANQRKLLSTQPKSFFTLLVCISIFPSLMLSTKSFALSFTLSIVSFTLPEALSSLPSF